MASLIPLLLILVVMYLLLVRPQQQRARRQREMVAALDIGTTVQTVGGIIGQIVEIDGDELHLEVAPGTVITFVRAAVARVVDQPAEVDDALSDEDLADGEATDDDLYDEVGDQHTGAGPSPVIDADTIDLSHPVAPHDGSGATRTVPEPGEGEEGRT